MTHAGHELVHSPEQARVDLSKEDDDDSMNSKDSGSSPRYTSGGEEDKANTRPLLPSEESSASPDGNVDAF
jgi:hypothetical protein